MRVLVPIEARFERTPDGRIWSRSQGNYEFWQRYRSVFSEVRVVARILDVSEQSSDAQLASGAGVEFVRTPYFVGPLQFVRQRQRVLSTIKAALRANEAVILRAPGTLAQLVYKQIAPTRHPYGIEVVGDPDAVFAPGAVRHPLRRFFRWWYPRQLRTQCRNACAAAYVSSHRLPELYPAGDGRFATYYSTLQLDPGLLRDAPRSFREQTAPYRLILIGSLAQVYKGVDTMIDALALLADAGLKPELVILGDGRHRAELEQQARDRGVADRVQFLGRLPSGGPVFAQLDRSDLMVMPSRTEGLPRAMIEAQARALPCIGSDVGGIPELLQPDELFPHSNPAALAAKLAEVLRDPQRLSAMSARNLERARNYTNDVLQARREAFYREVAEHTQRWIAKHDQSGD